MNHISLFSGIGGFDLAAEWMGWENIAHCEWNTFGQRVLKYYWPNAISYHDITKTDFTIHRGTIDIVTGGFPCQPYSVAGKRKGKDDERHLWPEMLRAIREIQPRWVVGENVGGLLSWNGGLVFNEVQADLEAEGYEILPFLLPAASVNAPHKRDRIWFVAYAYDKGRSTGLGEVSKENGEISEWNEDAEPCNTGVARATTDTFCSRWKECNTTSKSSCKRHCAGPHIEKPDNWQNFPTQSPVRLGNDGFSRRLERYITNELEYEISKTSKENRIENLFEVWERIQQEEVWEAIRGLYSLESKEVLFQTMQLYSTEWPKQRELSPFSEDFSKKVLRRLSKYREFRCTPQGRKLEKQRTLQLTDLMSFLPHEIALASKTFEDRLMSFDTWWRNESIKAGGNAIVPQVALQIFKAIEQHDSLNNI